MTKTCTLALLTGLSTAALADPETYRIEGSHTLPRFEYNHLGFSNQVGRFNRASGTIVIDRAARTGSVEAVIDATAVDTGSAEFDRVIQGEDLLDTARYPTITFKSERVRFRGEDPATVEGQLTIKGVTRPVVLTLTSVHCALHPIVKKQACGANVYTSIKRSDFNAGKYAPAVSDQVTLNIPVEAIRE